MKINPKEVNLCEDSYEDTSEYYVEMDGEQFFISKKLYDVLKLRYSDPEDIYWVYSAHQEPIKQPAKYLWAGCNKSKDEQEAWREYRRLRSEYLERQAAATRQALANITASLEELKSADQV